MLTCIRLCAALSAVALGVSVAGCAGQHLRPGSPLTPDARAGRATVAESDPFQPRASSAPGGRAFIAEIAEVPRIERAGQIVQAVLSGNVPTRVRRFAPINVRAIIDDRDIRATYWVTWDYLAIGADNDFVRIPMTPASAQRIADALGCVLPTRKMVDHIYAQAPVKLAPAPISPAQTDITDPQTFLRHQQMIEEQRAKSRQVGLIAGIKKDVVISPRLAERPDRVAIYGWHRLTGRRIQPLYLGHVDWYVDYSHGIRLVKQQMLVDGEPMRVADVLADPDLHPLLSDEGPVPQPRYPLRAQ